MPAINDHPFLQADVNNYRSFLVFQISGSVVHIYGRVDFLGNKLVGTDNGALQIFSLGQVMMHKGSNLSFRNNTGRLFHQSQCLHCSYNSVHMFVCVARIIYVISLLR